MPEHEEQQAEDENLPPLINEDIMMTEQQPDKQVSTGSILYDEDQPIEVHDIEYHEEQ